MDVKADKKKIKMVRPKIVRWKKKNKTVSYIRQVKVQYKSRTSRS